MVGARLAFVHVWSESRAEEKDEALSFLFLGRKRLLNKNLLQNKTCDMEKTTIIITIIRAVITNKKTHKNLKFRINYTKSFHG